jgi:hypothetical protein
MARPLLETITLAALIDGIRTGRWSAAVERVRAVVARKAATREEAKQRDVEAKAIKEKLPAVLASGIFDKMGNGGLLERTGLICADLDDLGDALPGYREHIESDQRTLACFLSPSGTGLKVVLRLDLDRSHEDGFRAMRRHFLENFGLEVDEACKNVGRACFVSYDPAAVLATNAELLSYPPATENFAAPEEKMVLHVLLWPARRVG